MPEVTSSQNEKQKRPRHRSPNYPAFSLERAIEKARKLYAADGRAPSTKDAAVRHLGYDKLHGEAGRALSALRSFDLIAEVNGRIQLTQTAIDAIVRDPGDPARRAALYHAVQSPDIYQWIFKHYSDNGSLPSDTSIAAELEAVKRFNRKAVVGFVKDFGESLEFAGLSYGDVVDSYREHQEQLPTVRHPGPKPPQAIPPPIDVQTPPMRRDKEIKAREISVPVGFSDDGDIIFAHVRFDGPLSRSVLQSLKGTLESLEKNLPN